jgi:hypothetical protein
MVSEDETAVGYDNALGLETLRFLRHIIEATNTDVATSPDFYQQLFFAGKLGFYITSPSSVRSFAQTVGNRFTMRTAPYLVTDQTNGRRPSGGNAATILAHPPISRRHWRACRERRNARWLKAFPAQAFTNASWMTLMSNGVRRFSPASGPPQVRSKPCKP